MTDLRLHRAKGAPRPVERVARVAEHIGECRRFGRIANFRPGAVRLDQLDGARIDPGAVVGVVQAALLPLGRRCVNRVAFAVAAGADSLQHRVDGVPGGLGVGQALEHDHAQPFAEGGAVAVGIERPRLARLRQGRGLAEAHEHEDVVERVGPAGDHDIGLARGQFHRREVQRTQRAGAGRIDDAVRAVQIEPVGDPPRDHVAEQTGEAVLLPGHVAFGNSIHHVLGHVVGDAGIFEGLPPLRVTESGTEWDHQFECPRDAEDHRGLASGNGYRGPGSGYRRIRSPSSPRSPIPDPRHPIVEDDPRVGQRLLGRDESQQLRGVGRFEITRDDAEFERVEVDGREEAAAPGIGAVGRFRVGVEIVGGVPVRRRHVADAIDAVLDVGPVRTRPVGLGEQAADADDGQGHHFGFRIANFGFQTEHPMPITVGQASCLSRNQTTPPDRQDACPTTDPPWTVG